MNILVGIDDTDNKESRGTGFKARELARLIEENKLGLVKGITRHQLFIHDDIPYTSQNSSACLEIATENMDKLTSYCREYLLEVSAPGSDAGLCVVQYNSVDKTVVDWGLRAKKEVLTQMEAKEISEKNNIALEGLTGTKDGIIGAMAAVGLRASENDGRFIWLKGEKNLRELEGIYLICKLKEISGIERVITKDGTPVPNENRLFVGDWVRPVLKNNNKLLIVEEVKNYEKYEWKVVTKEFIKLIS